VSSPKRGKRRIIMSKKKTLKKWAPAQLGQLVPFGQPPASSGIRTLDAVLTLGVVTGATVFMYGAARESTSNLVKTAGYVTAGLLGASLVAGLVVAITQ
jgi:hypothetical protein